MIFLTGIIAAGIQKKFDKSLRIDKVPAMILSII